MNKKNVILITIDCLRADHLSCYGYKRKTASFIDFLATEGALFENAFANGPFTVASFLSILASAYPLDFENQLPLPKNAVLISKILQKKGIQTAAIHSNPYLSAFHGYNRGWDFFVDFLHSTPKERQIRDLIKKLLPKRVVGLHRFFKYFFATTTYKSYEDAEIITNCAISWLNRNKNFPFFLWLHYMDLHEPYLISNTNAKRKYSKNISRLSEIKSFSNVRKNKQDIEIMRNIYDDKLGYVDENLKNFFDFLKNERLTTNTLILLTSDHGQEFLDHEYFGHSARFYDENLHIPLILFGSGIKKQSIENLVSQIDIAPTILHFYNIPIPKQYRGHSLLSNHTNKYMISEAAHNKDGVYIQNNKIFPSEFRTYSIRTKKWKYIHKEEGHELYNLIKDPKETRNIVDKEVAKAEEFESGIMNHILQEKKALIVNKKIKELKSSGKI